MKTPLVTPRQQDLPMLIEAVHKGDATEVLRLLDSGTDANRHPGDSIATMLSDGLVDIAKSLLVKNMALNEYFSSALLLAVSKQDANIVSILLENGANVNLDNHAWFTKALQKAVTDGRPANSELLVEYGDAIQASSSTALCQAISLGDEEIVSQLLEAGADANFDNGLHLRTASSKGLEKVVGLLLQAGAMQTLNESDWFHKFIEVQQYQHARDLLLTVGNARRGLKRPPKVRQTPLLEAVVGGHTTTMSLLLGHKPAYDTEYDEALWHASKLGSLELVQKLVTKGANVNGDLPVMQDIGTCLAAASGNGHEEVVKYLLESGAECNSHLLHQKKAMSPLESACTHGYVSIAKLLLSFGANPNFHSWSGPASALSAAVNGGNIELISLLIEHDADVNYHQTNRDGPLECAANNGNLEVFELLLKKGARITTRADVHRTTIQAAGYGGNKDVIQLVLNTGVDINSFGTAFDSQCVGTALQSAALNGHLAAVFLLHKNGADIHSIRRADQRRRNALGFAASGGNIQVLMYLLDKGCQHTAHGGPLYFAAAFGNIEVIQYLLCNKPEHSSDHHVITSLEIAAKESQWDVIPALLSTLIPILISNDIVRSVVVSGNEALVRLLIQKGVRITAALEYAIIARKHRIYLDLLNQNPDVAFGNNRFLRIAAWHGDVDLVKTLITRGADVNDSGPMTLPSYNGIDYNATALNWACSSRNPGMVRFLLENGADIALGSIFEAAVEAAMGDQKIIDLLLEKRFQHRAAIAQGLDACMKNQSINQSRFQHQNSPVVSFVDRRRFIAVSSPRNTPTEGENLVQGIEPPLVERYREDMSGGSGENSDRKWRYYIPTSSEIEEESDGSQSRSGKSLVRSRVQFEPSESDSETIPEKECNLTLKVYRQGSDGYLSHKLRIYKPDRAVKLDDDIDSDEKLFEAIRRAYLQHLLGYGRRFFSMKGLKRITVRSYTSTTRPVEVPFDDEFLNEFLSLFNDPSKVDSKDKWIKWIFKLKLGKHGRKHILVFKEGWDGARIALAGSLPFVASFLVAIIWGSLGGNLQTVFSLSSFVLAASSALLALVAILSTLGG